MRGARTGKSILVVVLVTAFLLQGAFAAERTVVHPNMSFVGSTARCEVLIRAKGKAIQATLQLWRGNTMMASWAKSGTNNVTITGYYDCAPGIDYTLTVVGTIGGVPIVAIPVTGSYE